MAMAYYFYAIEVMQQLLDCCTRSTVSVLTKGKTKQNKTPFDYS